jgi:hypothetical protein
MVTLARLTRGILATIAVRVRLLADLVSIGMPQLGDPVAHAASRDCASTAKVDLGTKGSKNSVVKALRSAVAARSCLVILTITLTGPIGTGSAAVASDSADASLASTSLGSAALQLSKTADDTTVTAGNRIGFRLDLMNQSRTPEQGRVIIESRVEPPWASDGATFDFGGDLGGFTIGGSEFPVLRSFVARFPGSYTVTEGELPAHFTLTGLNCDDGDDGSNLGDDSNEDVPNRTATIHLQAGETVRCLFTHTDPALEPNGEGRVIIEKQAPADHGPGEPVGFFQAGTLVFPPTFLAAGEAAALSVAPGTHTITETALSPGNAEFVSLDCDDENSTEDQQTRTATIHVEPNETVRCTFVNRVRVEPDALNVTLTDQLPSGPGLEWSMDPEVAGCAITGGLLSCSFASLADGQSVAVHLVSPTSVSSCGSHDNTAVVRADNRTEVRASASVTVICPATIIVKKQTLPTGSPQSFHFTPSYGDGFGLRDGETNTSAPLDPRAGYSVSEAVPSGWDLTSASCDDGSPVTNIDLGPGEAVTCTFTNTKRGTIIVEKRTIPAGATGSFSFSGDASGSIGHGGEIVVANLVPGSYTATEADPTSTFDLTDITCREDVAGAVPSSGNLGRRTATFKLDPGETIRCTFINNQRGMVDVRKITNGVPRPDLDIKFTLYETRNHPLKIDGDVQLEELSTLNDQDGLLEFQTKLVPDTTYTVCEDPVPAGWTSMWKITFQLGGQMVTPYNPNALDSPPDDVGIRCFNFTVQPGQTVHFEVRNDFPGGEPRTIGYWKNWNRCTGGGQAKAAEANGGAANGFFLVEDLLPQLVGDLTVDTCAKAVSILDKSSLDGKKRANDAAYELAAQLLAARFNLAAGAETCSALQNTVLDAQALLDAINFTGIGSYLTKASTNRTIALDLAATLDAYNNGNLC